jgi:hypothetical protein
MSLTLTELKASVMGCKEGMARVFAVQVQILLSITRVAVQSCHGAGKLSSSPKLIRSSGGIAV